MKKLLLLALLVVGCENSTEPTTNEIDVVGTWACTTYVQYENSDCSGDIEGDWLDQDVYSYTMKMIFNSDSSGIDLTNYPQYPHDDDTLAFLWFQISDKVTLSYDHDDDGVGDSDGWLFTLTDTSLIYIRRNFADPTDGWEEQMEDDYCYYKEYTKVSNDQVAYENLLNSICEINIYTDGTWHQYYCYEEYSEDSCIAKANSEEQYHFDYWSDNVTCEEYCEENSGSGAFGGCWINPNP